MSGRDGFVVLACYLALGTGSAAFAAEPSPAPASQAVSSAERREEPPANLWTRSTGVDWPGFLGPQGNGKSPETGIRTDWGETGPPILWQRELGEGYSIGSVSEGRFYQFDRIGNQARLVCLHAETGEELWQFTYPTDYADYYGYDGGPRSSPVVDGRRVYIYGPEGMLHCVDAVSGQPIWKCNTVERFGVVQNFFGVGSTPVVEGDLLIVMVGGSPPADQGTPPLLLDRVDSNGTGIVAFDKYTGEVRYTTSDELASYSSPQLATINGRRWCFLFARRGLLGIEPQTGKVEFHFPWQARNVESVNASNPVVVGDQVFISETYGPGSALLQVQAGGYQVLWQDEARSRKKALQAHWNTPIYHEGYLYGSSGRNPPDADLRCIRWDTGEVMWTVPNRTRCSLLYADGHFICQSEFGELQLLKANPERYELVAEVMLRDPDAGDKQLAIASSRPLLKAPCWAAPILAHGLLYVRGRDRLVCLELIPQ